MKRLSIKKQLTYLKTLDWDILDFENESSKQNKEILLEMARNGEPKPKDGKNDGLLETKLATALGRYTNQKSPCYDKLFDNNIHKLRPDWFEKTFERNKIILLEMARLNTKPKTGTALYSALYRYTNINSDTYDENFIINIKKLQPKWLINPSEIANQNKQKLLEMAKNGEPRPKQGHYLYHVLRAYTRNSECYDPIFDQKIRKLRPDWFENSAVKNRKKLLKLAQDGKDRPHNTTKLGINLYSYTNKNNLCYNPSFDKEIRKFKNWFKSGRNSSSRRKQELLKLAKSNKPKPKFGTALHKALHRYTNKKEPCYDQEFDKEIRKLRPDWFVMPKETLCNTKQELLKYIKDNRQKPKVGTKLYQAFTRYTNKNCKNYDINFTKQIQKLKPDLFVDTVKEKKLELLKIIKKTKILPKYSSSGLYRCFRHYIDKNDKCYDVNFTKQVNLLLK